MRRRSQSCDDRAVAFEEECSRPSRRVIAAMLFASMISVRRFRGTSAPRLAPAMPPPTIKMSKLIIRLPALWPAGYELKAGPSRARMMFNGTFTQLLLIGLAGLLVVAAVIDMRTFTISNRLNLAVALLAPVYWLSISRPWPGVAIQLGTAIGVFAVFAAAFYVGMMGGGDVKLAAALALWFPPASTLQFIVWMSLAGGMTLVVVLWHRMKRREEDRRFHVQCRDRIRRPRNSSPTIS